MTKQATFETRKLDDTLYLMQDVFERASARMLLVAKTLNEAKEGALKSGLNIGVREKEMGEFATKTLNQILGLPVKKTKSSVMYEYDGIPIKIHLLSHNDRRYRNPDMMYYNYNNYYIPNGS